MSWGRNPLLLVFAFVSIFIALGLGWAIVAAARTEIALTGRTIASAQREIAGVRELARTRALLAQLYAYRDRLLAAELGVGRSPLPAGLAPPTRAALAAAIAQLGPPRASELDQAAAPAVAELQARWTATSSRARISAVDVSNVIAAVQPLIVAIATASGMAGDPSIDVTTYGDALVRFPLSLGEGSVAAITALRNLAAGDDALPARLETARQLARADAAGTGRRASLAQIAVDPRAAGAFTRAADADHAALEALARRITTTYVEPARTPRARADRVLLERLRNFSAAGFAVIDKCAADLEDLLDGRIAAARNEHQSLLVGALGRLCLDVLLLLNLAGMSIVNVRNARKRIASERTQLASARAELETELNHARAAQDLLRAKAQFQAIFDYTPAGMVIVDRDRQLLETNAAMHALFPAGTEPSPNLVILDHTAVLDAIFSGALAQHFEERRYVDGANEPRWFSVAIAPVRAESGDTMLAVFMLRDITEKKSLEARLVFEARHDALTGLPNRNHFLRLLQAALDRRRDSETTDVFSVVFIDFNDFKTINDSFGHAAGDHFLIEGSARLRDSVRSTDVIARIGGDEFAVMLYGSDRADIEKSVVRLQSVLTVPVNIEGQLVTSSASFGIAQAEPNYLLAPEIIRDADTAMYQAKSQGGHDYVVFDASMREKVVRRMQLSIDIVSALERGEMELLYQPIVNLENGKLAGCEALARWRRPDGAFILPAEFIPLAEENGSIIEIGRWVTTTACRQLQLWNEAAQRGRLRLPSEFVMHVNLAVPEVHHIDLLSSLKRTLVDAGVSREQIILEITEGIVLKNTEQMRATLDALSQAGFRLCIDDFGTGYSSLRFLNELPLHSFKIDRSFVSNGAADLANASVVEMLMMLARSLGLKVVAEGIETPSQWEMLRRLGCRRGQGYLFAPPIDAAALTHMLEADISFWAHTCPPAVAGRPR